LAPTIQVWLGTAELELQVPVQLAVMVELVRSTLILVTAVLVAGQSELTRVQVAPAVHRKVTPVVLAQSTPVAVAVEQAVLAEVQRRRRPAQSPVMAVLQHRPQLRGSLRPLTLLVFIPDKAGRVPTPQVPMGLVETAPVLVAPVQLMAMAGLALVALYCYTG